MTHRFMRFTIFASALFCQPLIAAPTPVHEFQLDNGLKILVKEDHRAPVVVSEVWYKVGASYEPPGITGISHALEHMMFKGTEKHKPGEFSKIISDNGGRENAFTSRDYTGYYQQLERSRLPISFELEADRMRNLVITDEEFAKEIQVVMEERRLRVEDDPQSIAVEQFFAAAHVNSPYRVPVIGWMEDLKQMMSNDLKSWYQTWYAPNNATLIVVGDVDPQAVYKLAQEHFGALKPSTIPTLKLRPELAQKGTKRLTVNLPAELPFIIFGYQAPSLKTAPEEWEAYALEVLAAVLDGGDSARFATDLVRGSQIAAQADAGYSLYSRFDNLFTLDATPNRGKNIGEVEKALREQVARIRKDPPTHDELERVKAQVVAQTVYEKDSIFYQAMQLGSVVTSGMDWRVVDQYLDKIRAVTAAQVHQVANKYLREESLTIAELQPIPNGKRPPAPSGGAPQTILH